MSAGMLESNYSEPRRAEEGQSIREGRWSASQRHLVIIIYFYFIISFFIFYFTAWRKRRKRRRRIVLKWARRQERRWEATGLRQLRDAREGEGPRWPEALHPARSVTANARVCV